MAWQRMIAQSVEYALLNRWIRRPLPTEWLGVSIKGRPRQVILALLCFCVAACKKKMDVRKPMIKFILFEKLDITFCYFQLWVTNKWQKEYVGAHLMISTLELTLLPCSPQRIIYLGKGRGVNARI